MATVTSAPASTPSTGFCSWVNSWMKRGLSFRGATAFSMVNRPVNRMPKPMQIWPMLRFLGLFKNTNSTAPTKATMGRKVLGLGMVSTQPEPEMSLRRMSWPVTVVPMLAPMMTPMAWDRVKMPLFTRPMQMTVVPALDWMSPVRMAPSRTAFQTLLVSRWSTASILPPASFSRPVPMMDMPYKNRAMPPARLMTLKMVIPSSVRPAAAWLISGKNKVKIL